MRKISFVIFITSCTAVDTCLSQVLRNMGVLPHPKPPTANQTLGITPINNNLAYVHATLKSMYSYTIRVSKYACIAGSSRLGRLSAQKFGPQNY